MEVKIVYICLLIRSMTALYTKHQPEEFIKPEFSLKTDICKGLGQSLEVNCSIHDKYIRLYTSTQKTVNCSFFSNCSGTSIQSAVQRTFDINRLNIIHCTSSDRNSCMSEEIFKINEKTVRLFKTHVKTSDTGTYFCQYNNVTHTEDNFHLTVGDCPVGPDDITCVSMELMDLKCSWTKSRLDMINPLPVRYKSYFKSRPQFGEFDCPRPKPKKIFRDDISCILSDKFHPSNSYTLYINITNCLGNRIIEHNVSITGIVKLLPPIVTSVNVEDRRIQLNLNLNSTTERTLIWIKNISYNVTYASAFSRHVKFFNSSEEDKINVTLPDLIPYTTYNITIKCKGPETIGDEYWSRPITLSYRTKPAAPSAVPVVPPGGFSINSGSLSLYLKPIERRDKYAENAHYKVSVRNASDIIRVFNVSWDITTIENVTTLDEGSDYKIDITTCNAFGESINSSSVTIQESLISVATRIKIIVEKLGLKYLVFWNIQHLQESEENAITVYWCHGQRRNNFCKSDLNWSSVSNAQNNITIGNLTDKLGGEWLFALSYKYKDGYSTGMVFSKCYFSSSNDAPAAVEPFNVVVESTTELQVTPLLYCKYTSRPLKFIVYYKEVQHNVKSCDQSFQRKEVSANIETSSLTVSNLKQSGKYAVCLSVVTKGGSQTSDVQLVQMHDEESELIYIILGVVVAVLLISIVLFSICKFRRKLQKPIHIELPQLRQRKYDKVSTIPPEPSRTIQNRYSSDSGVSSNTISADNSTSNCIIPNGDINNTIEGPVTYSPCQDNILLCDAFFSNLTISDDSISMDDIPEDFMNSSSQIKLYEDGSKAIMQKGRNSDYVPNGQDIILTNNGENDYKQIPLPLNSNKCEMSNLEDSTSYRKITLSSSGIGQVLSLSHGNCVNSNLKKDKYKIMERVKSIKPTSNSYISNDTQTKAKKTSKIDLPTSEIISVCDQFKGNDCEIPLLFDETGECDRHLEDNEAILFHSSNLKKSCVDSPYNPGYV